MTLAKMPLPDNPIGPSLFSLTPTEQWAGADSQAEYYLKERVCAATPYAGHGAPPNPPLTPLKFNPTLMAELHLPNGERYRFRYN